jgi:uncharacterized protein
MISGGEAGAGRVGIGLRAPHIAEIIAAPPPVGWLEVHTENYLGGGPGPRALDRIRREHAVSLHGVGLSLGTAEGLDLAHLARVVNLARRVEPLPYTDESLALVARHVTQVQEALGRPLLVENPSGYLRFRHSPIPEPEFLAALARRTGCGLLCDVNNVFVTCRNFDQDPAAYLDALPPSAIGEIHLAGHARNEADGRLILIDDHGSPVADEVWALYARALERFGPRPTLIEWDTDIPALSVLLGEARHAEAAIARSGATGGARAVAA